MKRASNFIGLLFLAIIILHSAAKSRQLRLPIRVMGERSAAGELVRSDVRLVVNGHPTEVIRLVSQERSLARTPDLGRNFILSFHIGSVPQSIVNAVSFFASEILNTHDTLVLLTPIKAYRIAVSIDKVKTVAGIIELLRQDTSSYIKQRASAERYLEKEIDKLNPILSGRSDSPASNPTERSLPAFELAANYNAIHQFLLNFPTKISGFKDQYLLPNIVRHQEINKLLGKRHGERWWIHFQHREDIQIIHKANEIGRKLDSYIASQETGAQARTMSKALSDLKEQLLISNSIPQEAISDTLQKGNICYSVVYWGILKASNNDSFVKETSDLEGPLRRISDASGGITVATNDPENGLMAIKDHQDRFFEIFFEHNGDIKETSIQVSTEGKQVPLSYKQRFSKEDVEEWIDLESAKSVEIDDFSLKNETLHFVLHSFQKDQENKFGVIKVRLRLRDKENRDVLKSENTLRAAQDRVSISIPLPEGLRGEFRLLISAFDLLANTVASYEHDIRID